MIASVLLALGVMLGAFGAHALRSRLDAYLMSIYDRAVFYHFIHALGMLVVSVLPKAGVLPANSMGGGLNAPHWSRDSKRILFAAPNLTSSLPVPTGTPITDAISR